jgi:hypothetical protein
VSTGFIFDLDKFAMQGTAGDGNLVIEGTNRDTTTIRFVDDSTAPALVRVRGSSGVGNLVLRQITVAVTEGDTSTALVVEGGRLALDNVAVKGGPGKWAMLVSDSEGYAPTVTASSLSITSLWGGLRVAGAGASLRVEACTILGSSRDAGYGLSVDSGAHVVVGGLVVDTFAKGISAAFGGMITSIKGSVGITITRVNDYGIIASDMGSISLHNGGGAQLADVVVDCDGTDVGVLAINRGSVAIAGLTVQNTCARFGIESRNLGSITLDGKTKLPGYGEDYSAIISVSGSTVVANDVCFASAAYSATKEVDNGKIFFEAPCTSYP